MNLDGQPVLSTSQRHHLQRTLQQRRQGLIDAICGLERALVRGGGRLADAAGAAEAHRRGKLLLEYQRTMLREIEAALVRLANDEFGISEKTGDLIDWERLQQMPWARSEPAAGDTPYPGH